MADSGEDDMDAIVVRDKVGTSKRHCITPEMGNENENDTLLSRLAKVSFGQFGHLKNMSSGRGMAWAFEFVASQ